MWKGCLPQVNKSDRVTVYEASESRTLPWESMRDGEYAKAYLSAFMQEASDRYVKNVRTRFLAITVDDLVMPLTVNETGYDNSYVCSPYTHYISYAKEELRMLQTPFWEGTMAKGLDVLGWMMRKSGVNRIACINNWLLSTNLYPDVTPWQVSRITRFCTERFPRHAIAFRSVCPRLQPSMYEGLRAAGYIMVPSRYVYLFHPDWPKQGGWRVRNTLKRDRRMLEKSGYRVVVHDELKKEQVPRIIELYNALYLDKYSRHNPQFTPAFIRLAMEKRTLNLIGLEKEGRLDGILGYFQRNGVMTTPLFGYDVTLPKETGLYRILSSLLVQEAERQGLLLHQSAGVGAFKADRGAVGEVEYTAVYLGHLPKSRSVIWQALSFLLNRFGIPLVEKYRL